MANTITSTPLVYGVHSTVLYWTLVSDGTQETARILYDSSAVASILGIPDPLNCAIQEIKVITRSAAGLIRLDFDATTDVLALPLPATNYPIDMCFTRAGGLKNYAGVGRTGDILLTTTGLAAGDLITIYLDVRPTA